MNNIAATTGLPTSYSYLKPQQKRTNNVLTFGKKLEKSQLPEYRQTVKEALNVLDKDNFGIIIHGPSFPIDPSADTGFGSPYTSHALQFMKFLDQMGFNCIQLGPSGKTKSTDPSPYTSTIFSGNPLFIDLENLTSPEWGCILDKNKFKSIVKSNPNQGKAEVAYKHAYEQYDKALREAFEKFQTPEALKPEDIKTIQQKKVEFESFKEKNKLWLDNDALYEALSKTYGNDYWPNWEGENADIDKKLVSMLVSKDPEIKAQAEKRKAEVEKHPEVEFYKFSQFVLEQQKNKIQKTSPVNTIADIQVTYSDRDWWAYQNLFLDDYRLGVPPDFFSKDGQAWGFPVMNPDLIFEKDEKGNLIKENGKPVLGEAGKLIKTRFDKMFQDNPGGVRIDHILGLIDPWVYPADASTARSDDGGLRLFSSPESKFEKFQKWSKIGIDAINPDENPEEVKKVRAEKLDQAAIDKYAEIIDLIILSASDNNVPKSNIICEDLGTVTPPAAKVLEDRELSGLRVTEFVNPNDENHIYMGKNVKPQHWIVPGTHDNDSLISWAESVKDNIAKHIGFLKKDLKLGNKTPETTDSLVKAKFAELFASPSRNIQVMFMDVFGMKDRYNNPGAKTPEELSKNWRLRVPNNYEDFYYKQLSEGKGLNLPEALETAMKARGKEFAKAHEGLISKLNEFAEHLKKPEN